ncbi:MAG: TonB-dependent receptor [Bacteroidota bacterium]
MKQVYRYVCWLVWVGWGSGLLAQTDSLYQLPTVQIEASRADAFSAGTPIKLDSADLAQFAGQSLAEALSFATPLYVKQYGPGNLATLSQRGGSANHTAILWQGINLQSPMNGQLDLSLLPAYFWEGVSLSSGGESALFGSGAIGGTLNLSPTPFRTHKGYKLHAQLVGGSFGRWEPSLGASWGTETYHIRLRAYGRTTENDFPVTGRGRQPHAIARQGGWMLDQSLKLGSKQQLGLHIWHQGSDRQLPPTLLQARSVATQQDESLRMVANWQHVGEKNVLRVRAGYFREYLRFQDSLANLDSRSASQQFTIEGETNYRIHPQHLLHIGVNHIHTRAEVDGYGSLSPRQSQSAIFAAYRWNSRNRQWTGNISMRQALVDSNLVPFVPSFDLSWQPGSWGVIHTKWGRTFRIPTFNDLFWEPGGNPDLEPETGWSREVGVRLFPKKWIHISLTGYQSNVQNWILWQPTTSGFWSPENVREVRIQGLESELQTSWKITHWQLRMTLRHQFTDAQSVRSLLPRDASIGKQLIHTPRHQAQAQVEVSHQKWRLAYQHQFVGRRFTRRDNSDEGLSYDFGGLPAFQTGRLTGSYAAQWKALHATFFFQVENILDHRYQVMASRPMPGRQASLGIQLQFTQP